MKSIFLPLAGHLVFWPRTRNFRLKTLLQQYYINPPLQ